jgi:seryl-tRNA synthetase
MLEIDAKRRRYIVQRDALRSRRNEVSKKIGRMREKPQDLIEEMRQVGDEIKNLDDQTKAVQAELNSILLTIPNIPLDSVPKGTGESQNIVVREFGQLEQLTFEALPHWDLGERLDIIDFERGAKLSGSRFYILKGMGAKLERALISWMLDVHTKKHGYTEISPPYLVKQETMLASGNLPKFADNLYQDTEDDLWLIPTAEVPLTSLHRNEIIQSEKLPLYYTAYTPCFRREKASAGKDTRGIKRVHQFGKVEMYKFVEPTTSNMELEKLINDAEDICRMLSIPYRIIELCTGDLGFNAAKTYDLEMWAAGSQEWLEVSSCSNCTDFQARRANIKYRSSDQNKTQFVHTLNGSGLALPRVIIAILENYQQSDGSVLIPEVLRPYTGFDLIR